MNEFNKRIAQILDDAYTMGRSDVLLTANDHAALMPKLEAAIRQAVLAYVIGEDDKTIGEMGQLDRIERIALNELRAQQRSVLGIDKDTKDK